ncbi:MAG: UDP-3-O-[3-hydroxymyristoyl] N-acetylglucosamine deacetylase [Syntrophus sp. (in: bacteria)]|nr:UDP-3-O-[3-hydroxymyristoyl] N-acetylglucosamine deacetylase [Syntrophus sp. (in: bacteria)]
MYLQRTLRDEIECKSNGLHSGRKVSMKIKPADADEGIVFIRTDLPGNHRIKADIGNVRDTTLATTIGNNGSAVSTIEHLMSAFSGMGIDNAIVEVNAPEVPIMDGSALPFVRMLKTVGTQTQGKCKKLLVINEAISVEDGVGAAMLLPAAEFKITYTIDFDHPAIGRQTYHMTFSDASYEEEICAARTFGFLKDVEYMQARGLALGGSLKNAVVLDDKQIINKEGLRCADEFVKHKILDAIGDLSLLGMPIIGHFIAYKSGHRLNNQLLQAVLARPESWSLVHQYRRQDQANAVRPLYVPDFRILDAVNA